MKNAEEKLSANWSKKIERRENKKRIRPKISGRSVFQIQALKKKRKINKI